MRGSVASEVEARVQLYRRVFSFCRQGGFSFARFLALVPERLRLALGDDARRIRVPVHVTDELRQRWRALLPPGERAARSSLYGSIPELKRLVRLAQVDPGVDVVCLSEWQRTSAEALTELTREVYVRALAEVGRGEGGLETAYLVHHLVLDTLAGLTRGTGAGELGPPRASLLASLLDLAIAAASASRAAAAVPARLGYQLAVTTSPWSLGAGAELVERHVNVYRTTREAVALARRVVQEPLELIDLERVVSTLSERQLVDPALHAGLRREVLLELVRDGLLLLVAQTWTPATARALELGRQVIGSPRALEQHLFVTRRRAELSAWLAAYTATHKAAAAVARLVDGAEQVLAGDLSPLGVHGDLRERAVTAARGAVVLVLDEHTEGLRRDVSALVEPVPAADAEHAWREGRAYRLGSGPEPLYTQHARAAEGYLLVDLSSLAGRLATLPARAAAEVVRRGLYDPIAAAVARASSGDGGLSIARWTSDQIAIAGDLVAVVELAVVVRAEVAAAAGALEAAVPEVLGGASAREAELDAELARLGERLATVEGALLRFSEDPASARFLRDSHAVLSRELGALSQARRRALARAHPVEVGLFVAVAEPAEVLELPAPGPARPAVRVYLTRAHAEAAACVGRGARLVAAREARRRAGGASSPFAVELERRIRVPVEVETRLHHALTTHDPQALAALAEVWAAEVEHTWDDELYNAGLALSGAALAAFAHDRRGVLVFEDRRVSPDDLPAELRRRFRLGHAPLELRAVTRATDGVLVHLFRRVGELRPPELESDVEVWEHLPLDGPFVQALEALAEGG